MKKELSHFLEMAYKYGKVKDVKEAFLEYPVDEEWHKGKSECAIKEESESYNNHYAIGDIVFVGEYLYSDGNSGNNHLFVIVD